MNRTTKQKLELKFLHDNEDILKTNFIRHLVTESFWYSTLLEYSDNFLEEEPDCGSVHCNFAQSFENIQQEVIPEIIKEINELTNQLVKKFDSQLKKLFKELDKKEIDTIYERPWNSGWEEIFPDFIRPLGIDNRRGNKLIEFEIYLQKLFDSRNNL